MNSLSTQHTLAAQGGQLAQRQDRSETLCECVRTSVRFYLHQIGDHPAGDLHHLVMREIERPLIEEVLDFTQGNQSRASALLGMSRTTLRKKIAQYQTGTPED